MPRMGQEWGRGEDSGFNGYGLDLPEEVGISKKRNRVTRVVSLIPFWRIGNRLTLKLGYTMTPKNAENIHEVRSNAMVTAYLETKQTLMEAGVDVDELDANFKTAIEELKAEATKRRLRKLRRKPKEQPVGDSRWDNIV